MKCKSCEGAGFIPCKACSGEGVDYGIHQCNTCSGKGEYTCSNCNGKGKVGFFSRLKSS